MCYCKLVQMRENIPEGDFRSAPPHFVMFVSIMILIFLISDLKTQKDSISPLGKHHHWHLKVMSSLDWCPWVIQLSILMSPFLKVYHCNSEMTSSSGLAVDPCPYIDFHF